MKVAVLASGSRGNCLYVEGESGAVLVDAGLSAREVLRRLDEAGGDPGLVEAILVTHEHTDHIAGVDVLARKLGVPVVGTGGTLAEFLSFRKRSLKEVMCITTRSGDSFHLGDFSIEPFSTFHDAAEPCGFCIREGDSMVGCCTDTGTVSEEMRTHLRRCSAIVLESNHCPQMLQGGPYPAFLKRRIRSRTGHLSNEAAAACLQSLASDIQTVILAHLSEVNNTPEKATASARTGLGLYQDAIFLDIGLQHRPGALRSV
ncbi:MAG: MBL fold metallo-hydrolase [Methanomicrobiaceae archaeon]|nr:MBL fold metallo-hydrolase [Methanomicrobiaceae archaeon]